jgi:hypothetical protein
VAWTLEALTFGELAFVVVAGVLIARRMAMGN